jgi:hypothetical protein
MFRPVRQFLVLAALFMAAVTLVLPQQANAQDARIEFEVVKVGLIAGVGGGSGTLFYRGQTYPLSIGGVSLGPQIGITVAKLKGAVYNLSNVADIEGTYNAATAGAAVIVGATGAQMMNGKNVSINVTGAQVGVALSLNMAGLKIRLK